MRYENRSIGIYWLGTLSFVDFSEDKNNFGNKKREDHCCSSPVIISIFNFIQKIIGYRLKFLKQFFPVFPVYNQKHGLRLQHPQMEL